MSAKVKEKVKICRYTSVLLPLVVVVLVLVVLVETGKFIFY